MVKEIAYRKQIHHRLNPIIGSIVVTDIECILSGYFNCVSKLLASAMILPSPKSQQVYHPTNTSQ